MNIFIVIIILLAISFIWALISLRQERKKGHDSEHVQKVKEELAKEKVIYQA